MFLRFSPKFSVVCIGELLHPLQQPAEPLLEPFQLFPILMCLGIRHQSLQSVNLLDVNDFTSLMHPISDASRNPPLMGLDIEMINGILQTNVYDCLDQSLQTVTKSEASSAEAQLQLSEYRLPRNR